MTREPFPALFCRVSIVLIITLRSIVMKRLTTIILAALLVTTMAGGASAADMFMKIGTGPIGGYWFTIGSVWSTLITDMVPGVKASPTPGGAISSIQAIKKKNMHFGFIKGYNGPEAVNGTGPFANDKYEGLRAVASLYPEPMQILFSKSKGYKTVQDLKGKHMSPGKAGFGGAILFGWILEANGMTYDDVKVSYLSYSDSALALKDKNMDFVAITITAPSATYLDVDVQDPLDALALDEKTIKHITSKYPVGTGILPKGTYSGMDKDVLCLSSPCFLVAGDWLDEETVYQSTKVFWENVEKFHAIAPEIKREMSLQKALDGLNIPLHKGAYKYYVEKGLTVPDQFKP